MFIGKNARFATKVSSRQNLHRPQQQKSCQGRSGQGPVWPHRVFLISSWSQLCLWIPVVFFSLKRLQWHLPVSYVTLWYLFCIKFKYDSTRSAKLKIKGREFMRNSNVKSTWAFKPVFGPNCMILYLKTLTPMIHYQLA